LRAAGCAKIYEDHLSGVKAARPGLEQALEVARAGDVLVVWRLDRLGRSLKDLLQLVESLDKRNIELQSLQESLATHTSGGRLIFHLFGALEHRFSNKS
jgi:DNA invertase Pin-like site-specific DNA recombinase